MRNTLPKKVELKVGQSVFIRGMGIAKVKSVPNIKTPQAPNLNALLNLQNANSDLDNAVKVTVHSVGFQSLQNNQIAFEMIRKDNDNGTANIKFSRPVDCPTILPLPSREDVAKAMEQSITPQQPQCADLPKAIERAKQLIASKNIIDVGRAYAYLHRQTGVATINVAFQARHILMTAYCFYEKGEKFNYTQIYKAREKIFKKIPSYITPFIGQKPTLSHELEAQRKEREEREEKNKAPVSKPNLQFEKPVELSLEEKQEQKLTEYFYEIVGLLNPEESQNQEASHELAFLYAVFQADEANNFNFKQRYIVLHEAFGEKAKADIIKDINELSPIKAKKRLSEGNYKPTMGGALNEIIRIMDQNPQLELDQEVAEDKDAFGRLYERMIVANLSL